MSTKNNQISSNDHQMKKSIDLLSPGIFTILLVVEVGNFLANPEDPSYQFSLLFYALMACVWSWFHWDTNRDYEKLEDACDRLLELSKRIYRAEKEDGKRD